MKCSVPRSVALLAMALWPLATGPALAQAVITLDPATKYQTITGWEVVAQAAQDASPAFDKYADEVFDGAVNDIGITRLRLEVRSGMENTRDYWSENQSGKASSQDWRTHRYVTVNDNADPKVINRSGFQFAQLDRTIEKVVQPLRRLMKARGEQLYVNVNYVAFTRQDAPGTAYVHDDPEEYAEFVLAVYEHMQRKYRFVPDAWEVLLEPDNVPQWSGKLLGRAIVAASARLRAAGFTPRFIAPSNTNMGKAVAYFDEMIQVPGAARDLIEFSYHRYGGVSDANLQAIAQRGVEHHVNTSMLEWWVPGNSYQVLHKDLSMGRNSAWQQGVICGPKSRDPANALYTIDDSKPAKPVVTMNVRTKFNRQYYKFVRPGAVRIAASSSEGRLDPLAFINADGRWVVVAKVNGTSSFTIQGLPAGLYGIKYTTGDGMNVVKEYDKDLPDVALTAGRPLPAAIPDAGVITIYAKRPSK